jgi:hypothetical protein
MQNLKTFRHRQGLSPDAKNLINLDAIIHLINRQGSIIKSIYIYMQNFENISTSSRFKS